MGGAMLVSGGAASATKLDTEVKIRSIAPNPVVVKDGEETAYFDVGASSDVEKVVLSVQPDVQTFKAAESKDVDHLRGWRFSVDFNENDYVGRWKATAVAYGKDNKELKRDEAFFAVEVVKGKAETRISRFDAGPSKVRKGKSIYFSGRLLVDDEGWEGVRGEKVNVYYRANGSSGWKWVASGKTRWGGKFYAKTRAWKSGTFKAVYEGNDELSGAESHRDYVRVYRSWHHR
ncbi:hypothetical protein HII36_42210 [Nonomuraea sp. NN258]|uniref:hypothetical protein n=1 Tax=Nonomuraea antri TaxID=2730852 RepID=UPI00156A3622|nr:hypothetical protein [Nonomuraea antri]NRQ38398.1 hypothetical protein [Nonomuraea antri]